MEIIIDTTRDQGFEIALAHDGVIQARNMVNEPFQEAEQLIPSIEKILSDQGVPAHDVSEVWVVAGPGRFTAVRIAVAQAFAYAMNIPLRSIERLSPDESLSDMISRFLVADHRVCVQPVYDKDPHITQSV